MFFVYGDFYKFFETDRIIFREMLLNLGYAMLGIVIISVLLLISPRAVVIIVVCIATVDLFLFAEMWLFDIRCAFDALGRTVGTSWRAVPVSACLLSQPARL